MFSRSGGRISRVLVLSESCGGDLEDGRASSEDSTALILLMTSVTLCGSSSGRQRSQRMVGGAWGGGLLRFEVSPSLLDTATGRIQSEERLDGIIDA